jgi:prepilin-type N-terminal cleavage/methylation domain-containing protein
MIFSSKTIRGFTLIETLVAITILMISIVGPLTIASKGLVAAAGSRDQVVASYLAQDLMESVKNLRDSYLVQAESVGSTNGWATFLGTCPGAILCGMETAPNNLLSPSPGQPFPCASAPFCAMYTDPIKQYYEYETNGGTNIPTLFTRTFTLTQESNPDVAFLQVTVSWKEAGVTNSIVLNSVLFNTLR